MTTTDYDALELQQGDMILVTCTGLGNKEISEKLSWACILLLKMYCVDDNLLKTLEQLTNPLFLNGKVENPTKLKIVQRSYNWMRVLNGSNWDTVLKVRPEQAMREIKNIYEKHVVKCVGKAKELGVTVFDPKDVEASIKQNGSIDGVWRAATELDEERLKVVMANFIDVTGNAAYAPTDKMSLFKRTVQQMLIALMVEEDPGKFSDYASLIQLILVLLVRLFLDTESSTETPTRDEIRKYIKDFIPLIRYETKPPVPTMKKAAEEEKLAVSACHVFDLYKDHQLCLTGSKVDDIYGNTVPEACDVVIQF
ncbi:hypothetical protein Ciccas_014246, partial [Cichlidogyrus casuarinus]